MPYKIRGNAVYKKDTGKLVGKSKNPKRYLRILQAIEHGFIPTKGKKMRRKSKQVGKRSLSTEKERKTNQSKEVADRIKTRRSKTGWKYTTEM